jgi:hypothetical protein
MLNVGTTAVEAASWASSMKPTASMRRSTMFRRSMRPLHDRRVGQRLDRVEATRPLHHAGQQRALLEGEVPDRLGEVEGRGGAHAVHAVAVVGDVQVALEDLVLGQLLLDRQRVADLLELALDGVLAGRLLAGPGAGRLQQGVLDVLLGQRRPALGDLVGPEVLDGGAGVPLKSTPLWA